MEVHFRNIILLREMLTGASGSLVNAKKRNNIVIIALKTL